MSYLDDCIARLNTLPPLTSRHLRSIQDLDKQVEQQQQEMTKRQKDFLERFRQSRGKKIDNRTRQQLEQQYRDIMQLHKNIIGLANQKVKIAGTLYDLVHQPTERMETELNRMRQELKKSNQFDLDADRETLLRKRRGKERSRRILTDVHGMEEQDFEKNEPTYCYCGKPSFGEMVMCENNLCEKEWFHRECIPEKQLPDKWFCSNCRKNKDRKRERNGSYL